MDNTYLAGETLVAATEVTYTGVTVTYINTASGDDQTGHTISGTSPIYVEAGTTLVITKTSGAITVNGDPIEGQVDDTASILVENEALTIA